MTRHPALSRDVFCNFPFDRDYERLYVALLASVLCTGQTPRSVLEVPPHRDRLSRLVSLIAECPFSVHDLSQVRLSRGSFRVPRFNMPFELGLAMALREFKGHQAAILERVPYRLQHSLSDLNGYDPGVHFGRVAGMFTAVCDVFAEARPFPVSDERQFTRVYRAMRAFARRRFRGGSPYSRDRFGQLVVAGREFVLQASASVKPDRRQGRGRA